MTVKSNDDSTAKHKAISGRLSDYSGFKLIETVVFYLWKTNVVRLVIKPSHITNLTLR